MPRPKRTRATATRQTKGTEPAGPPAPHSPISDPTAASELSNDIYGLSDREKEKTRAKKTGTAADENNKTSEVVRTRLGTRASLQEAKALEQAEKRRDDAMARLDDLPTSKTMGTSSDDIRSPPEVGRRRSHASPRRSRPTDVSGLDLDGDTFGDLDDSLADGGGGSHGGQHSTDTSTLDAAAFRRRPRKSSIVGRDDAPIRPSSRGLNTPGFSSTFSFGQFKRRQREPSILSSRRNRSHSRQPYASGDESANERDFSRVFDPTPLRGASRQRSVAPSSEASRQPSPTVRTRKRKSQEKDDGSRKRAAVEPDEDEPMRASIEVGEDEDEDISLPARGRSPPRQVTPDPNDPDLAPPLSSGSSDGSPAAWPSLSALGHRTYRARRPAPRTHRTPDRATDGGLDGSDISSPPSLTHSPNFKPAAAARQRRARPAKEKNVTTADLASLLPQRRHKQTTSDPFDLESLSSDVEHDRGSDGGEDGDDELSRPNPRARRRAARSRSGVRNAPEPPKNKQNTVATGKKKSRRTYGSHGSDKENQGLAGEASAAADGDDNAEAEGDDEEAAVDPETSRMMLAKMGEELKKAAKKFKEVDRWELMYEEVVESSSPVAER